MFFKFLTPATLSCLFLSGCGVPEDHVQATQDRISDDSAIMCVAEGMQSIQTGTDAQEYIDSNYLQIKISEAFDVGNFFIFTNRRSIKNAFDDLAQTLFTGDEQVEPITITSIEPSHIEHAYTLSGELGDKTVEIDVRFFGSDDCRILDVRSDGSSVTALFIGRLASEPAFARQVEVDPFADPYE